MQFVTTLEEIKTFCMPQQFEKAKRARDLYHALGTPSINDFKAIITLNAIWNNPVTVEDINLAEKILFICVLTTVYEPRKISLKTKEFLRAEWCGCYFSTKLAWVQVLVQAVVLLQLSFFGN